MDSEPLLAIVLPWVVTYVVHSTVLLVCVALVTRIRGLTPRTRETLWRAALFGGLATATLAHAFSFGSVTGTIEVPTRPREVVADQDALAPSAPVEGPRREPVVAPRPPVVLPESPAMPSARAPAPSPAPPPAQRPAASAPVDLVPWALRAWALLALLSVVSTGFTRWRFRRQLAARTPVRDGVVLGLLRGLAVRAGVRRRVRLTVSGTLESPVVLGAWRPEICVPRRALTGLPRDQLEALLAHELAHVVRRDGLWRLAARTVVGLFPMQPLNRFASARLRANAEILCDAHAVAWTEHPVALAECLTEVAGWMVRRRDAHLAPAMAHPGSLLGDRVGRLLAPHATNAGRRLTGLALALVLLVGVAAAAPAASITDSVSAVEPAPVPDATRPEDPLVALDAELGLLDAELDALMALAAEIDDPRVDAAVRQVESLTRALRARRRALQSETRR